MAILAAGALLLASLGADDVQSLADQAGVSVIDLRGAVNTTGLDPRAYLYMTGELVPPTPPRDWIDRLLDCLAWVESRNTPTAVNPRSGASGLLQFLPSTWRTTPWARSSIFDAIAQRLAGRWMVNQGRLHEWSTWRLCA